MILNRIWEISVLLIEADWCIYASVSKLTIIASDNGLAPDRHQTIMWTNAGRLVTGEFPSRRPVTRSFDVFCDLRLHKLLSKHSRGWWFETPSRSWWRHCNGKRVSYNIRLATRHISQEPHATAFLLMCVHIFLPRCIFTEMLYWTHR